jgi:hypothetical protein
MFAPIFAHEAPNHGPIRIECRHFAFALFRFCDLARRRISLLRNTLRLMIAVDSPALF